jgi:hypothetical protein
MQAHIRFHWYMLRHKFYVFRVGLTLRVPFWQALLHDWTKYLPSEYPAYVDFFRGIGKEMTPYNPGPHFDQARNTHQKRNRHHWQYWLFYSEHEEPPLRPLPIPKRYIREMVADWISVGRVSGKDDTLTWYADNRERIILHPETRAQVEQILDYAWEKGLLSQSRRMPEPG